MLKILKNAFLLLKKFCHIRSFSDFCTRFSAKGRHLLNEKKQ